MAGYHRQERPAGRVFVALPQRLHGEYLLRSGQRSNLPLCRVSLQLSDRREPLYHNPLADNSKDSDGFLYSFRVRPQPPTMTLPVSALFDACQK